MFVKYLSNNVPGIQGPVQKNRGGHILDSAGTIKQVSVQHSIKVVAALSGLSPHTIRAWEKRYAVLTPNRTDTNRRLYEEADIQRLILLKGAVGAGHAISQVANLPDADLEKLQRPRPVTEPMPLGPDSAVQECIAAMERLDATTLEFALTRSTAALGVDRFIDHVVMPFIAHLDRGWENRGIRIAQEHLASATLRTHLERVRQSIAAPALAPSLLVTTPVNQVHELGALIVAILAAVSGWQVTYLGPNLPAREIAAAAAQTGARAVALSIVFPLDDLDLPIELKELRKKLDPAIQILIGGRGARHYKSAIKQIGGTTIADLPALRAALNQIRK